MPVSGTRKKRIPPFHISRKGAEAQRKAGKPACRAFTLRLCAFARFWGDMFFLSALKRIGSDMRGQKSGQRKLANLDGLELLAQVICLTLNNENLLYEAVRWEWSYSLFCT